ncbi:hypothetical protein EMCRGX_G010420 [Ephydatia muelleri]
MIIKEELKEVSSLQVHFLAQCHKHRKCKVLINVSLLQYHLLLNWVCQTESRLKYTVATTSVMIGPLLPHYIYTCSIVVFTAGGGSGASHNMTLIDVTYDVMLSWQPPLTTKHNGVIVNNTVLLDRSPDSDHRTFSDIQQVTTLEEESRTLLMDESQYLIVPSKQIEEIDSLKIYQPDSTVTFTSRSEDRPIVIRQIGKEDPHNPSPGIVLLLVGATGSGKSTLINALTNYVYGVQFDDCFRYKLILDVDSISQPQTRVITAYTFHKTAHSILPYTLTVIDTPGFGDTGGITRDKEIADQMKELFTDCSSHIVTTLHGVAFVVQASVARLTLSQRYVLDATLSIFGKDIGDNIMLMATFADSKKPKVFDAFKAVGIPFVKDFKFNSSALYTRSEDDDECIDEKRYWTMGVKSFTEFFTELVKLKPSNLYLTRDVLQKRQHLETTVRRLQPQIRMGLAKIDMIKQEKLEVQKHEAEIADSKDFTYTVEESRERRIDLNPGEITTNCQVCFTSCHFPCSRPNNEDKAKCSAMNSDGTCSVCPGHCSWEMHFNNPFRYEAYSVKIEKSMNDLKERYETASREKAKVEKIIATLENEMEQIAAKVYQSINDARKTIQALREIALKPNPMTEVEYIDLLIESEKSECIEGWGKRVSVLSQFRKQAILISKMDAKATEEKTDWSVFDALSENS